MFQKKVVKYSIPAEDDDPGYDVYYAHITQDDEGYYLFNGKYYKDVDNVSKFAYPDEYKDFVHFVRLRDAQDDFWLNTRYISCDTDTARHDSKNLHMSDDDAQTYFCHTYDAGMYIDAVMSSKLIVKRIAFEYKYNGYTSYQAENIVKCAAAHHKGLVKRYVAERDKAKAIYDKYMEYDDADRAKP